ncbi:hypothetical protein BP6252_03678 [Coleophoma cylindrospora]|uniref:Uncharacterized protein n=1 Tax=Coleophoma cylindrospora TaxID=1849047 RepID=A0A3D8S8B4_9HELO|nr:hypothetical protein BP6252_03678 [Coleophoma cylindrospora]
MSQNGIKGTMTPKMLEFERQAEARAREQEIMEAEQERMLEEQARMQEEQERIAQEQYEMEQYYEAEALKHADEMRIHQEEVRRHQERVREHERMVRDHEASMEAFAKVIAMPVKPARGRQVSFLGPPRGSANGRASISSTTHHVQVLPASIDRGGNGKDAQNATPNATASLANIKNSGDGVNDSVPTIRQEPPLALPTTSDTTDTAGDPKAILAPDQIPETQGGFFSRVFSTSTPANTSTADVAEWQRAVSIQTTIPAVDDSAQTTPVPIVLSDGPQEVTSPARSAWNSPALDNLSSADNQVANNIEEPAVQNLLQVRPTRLWELDPSDRIVEPSPAESRISAVESGLYSDDDTLSVPTPRRNSNILIRPHSWLGTETWHNSENDMDLEVVRGDGDEATRSQAALDPTTEERPSMPLDDGDAREQEPTLSRRIRPRPQSAFSIFQDPEPEIQDEARIQERIERAWSSRTPIVRRSRSSTLSTNTVDTTARDSTFSTLDGRRTTFRTSVTSGFSNRDSVEHRQSSDVLRPLWLKEGIPEERKIERRVSLLNRKIDSLLQGLKTEPDAEGSATGGGDGGGSGGDGDGGVGGDGDGGVGG